ncbi:MAG TPA: PAS domain S-box protein, partial [Longimicrobium sp.]|nr:PAS domain S-box protein [Longimicrobium sp.]
MSDAPATPAPSPAPPADPAHAPGLPASLLQAAAVGILGVAPGGTVSHANPEATRILGHAPDTLAGRPLGDLIGPPAGDDAQPAGASAIEMTLRDGAPRQGRGMAIGANGIPSLPLEYTVSALVEEGRITGAAVTLRDGAQGRVEGGDEHDLRLAEALGERTRRILESITDAFFALDHDWRFTWLNDEAEHLLARSREELMGRGIWDEFPAAVGTLFQQEYERAVREQRPVGFEAYYPPPLDATYEVRAYPSDDGLSVYFRNVSERIEAQRAVRESEERYRSLIEATSAIVWTAPASGEFGGEQPGWSAFTGQTAAQYTGTGWMACVHPDDRAHTAAAWTQALEARRPYETEHRLRRTDGEYREMWVRAVPVLHADGSIREWVGVHTDITEEKRVEAALRRSEESYRFLADTIPQLIWTTLPDGYHEYYNRRWYEYTGLSFEETRGSGWNDVLHPDDKERAWARWRHSLDTGEPYSIEYRFKGRDGVYRWFLGQALPFRDEDGRILRWFGTCTDIHDQKEAAQERDRLIAALDVERSRLGEVFREAPALILVTRGPEHRIEMANPPYRRLVGGRDIVGLPVRQALPEVDGQGLFELMDGVFRTGEPVTGSEMPVSLDRGAGTPEEGFINFVYGPLRNSLGEVEGILVHAVEVTDQVRARRQVERLEERLRLALESADIGTWDFHPRTGVLNWDERCKRVFGLRADDPVDYGVFLSRIHPADRARTDGLVQEALDPHGPGGYDTEYRVLWPDGTTRWVRAAGRAFFRGVGPGRQAVRFTGTVLDVTDRRQAEEE